MSETLVMAYLQDGAVATMPVSDRDKFQPGVSSTEAWDAMSAAERAALAAKGNPENIRQREHIRSAAEQRRKERGRAYGRELEASRKWNALPGLMYEGTEEGVIEWRRTNRTGVWEPGAGNVTRTERWDADGNDWVYAEEPARFPAGLRPGHALRKTADEARADFRALRATAG